MTLLRAAMAGLLASIRETLPSTEGEAGAFLAGLCWAFVLFWTALICVTWQHCAARGGC